MSANRNSLIHLTSLFTRYVPNKEGTTTMSISAVFESNEQPPTMIQLDCVPDDQVLRSFEVLENELRGAILEIAV